MAAEGGGLFLEECHSYGPAFSSVVEVHCSNLRYPPENVFGFLRFCFLYNPFGC
jgi:hypothetical protein